MSRTGQYTTTWCRVYDPYTLWAVPTGGIVGPPGGGGSANGWSRLLLPLRQGGAAPKAAPPRHAAESQLADSAPSDQRHREAISRVFEREDVREPFRIVRERSHLDVGPRSINRG